MQIAITGCGWVTPRVAGRIEDVLAGYARTKSEARYQPIPQTLFDQFPDLPAEAARETPVRIAAIALKIACTQANLSVDATRKGLVVGCALAGVSGMIDFANDVRKESTRFVSPIRFPQTVGNYIGGALARCYDFRGPASTVACGSASSLEAVREACSILASNQADAVVAGGCEVLSPEIAVGMGQPDVHFADGACFFVLERATDAVSRGAGILATVSRTSDHESTSPSAISTAGFDNPGTYCIERWIGRSLGADGAAALAAAVGAIHGQKIPGSAQRSEPKPPQVRVSAKGLGGADCTLIARRPSL